MKTRRNLKAVPPSPNGLPIAQLIYEFRARSGRRPEEVADYLGITENTYLGYESGST